MSPGCASRATVSNFACCSPEQFHRALHVGVGDGFGLAFDRQTVVIGQLKFRRGLDGGGELQRLPAAKLDFLDVRVADHGDFLFVHRLAIRIADELAFGLGLDVGLVFFEPPARAAPCPGGSPAATACFWKSFVTASKTSSTAFASTSTRSSFLHGARVSTVTFTKIFSSASRAR